MLTLQGHHPTPLQLQHIASVCNCHPGAWLCANTSHNVLTTVLAIQKHQTKHGLNYFIVCKDGDLLQEGDLRRARAAEPRGLGAEGQEEESAQEQQRQRRRGRVGTPVREARADEAGCRSRRRQHRRKWQRSLKAVVAKAWETVRRCKRPRARGLRVPSVFAR